MNVEFHNLLFGVRKSIRYHNYRRRFFERLSVTSDFLVIASGTTVVGFASAGGTDHHVWTIAFGALTAIVGSLDLVIGYSNKARDYRDLARDFGQLEIKMMEAGETCDDKTQIALRKRRLEIEQNEPPVMRVLDSYCHNELIRAMGYSKEQAEGERIRLTLPQSIFMPWFDWYPSALIKNKDRKDNNTPDKPSGRVADQKTAPA
jgi:hypothetical protein